MLARLPTPAGKIVIYYAGPGTKIYGIERLLKELTRGTSVPVVRADMHTIEAHLRDKPSMLVMPGHETGQLYIDELRGRKFGLINDAILAGMHVVGICAGSYVFSKNFDFEMRNDSGRLLGIQHKDVSSPLGIVPARAAGVDRRLYNSELQLYTKENPWASSCAAPLSCHADLVSGGSLNALLTMGPSFVALDPRCQVLASYNATAEAAIIRYWHGLGSIVMSGPAIEVGACNLNHHLSPLHSGNATAMSIKQALEETYMASRQLWVGLLQGFYTDTDFLCRVTLNAGLPYRSPRPWGHAARVRLHA